MDNVNVLSKFISIDLSDDIRLIIDYSQPHVIGPAITHSKIGLSDNAFDKGTVTRVAALDLPCMFKSARAIALQMTVTSM